MNVAQKLVRELKVGYYKLFPSQKSYYNKVSQINNTPVTGETNRLAHVGFFVEKGNAGDTLLPIMVRDLIDFCNQQPNNWTGLNAHNVVTKSRLEILNSNQAMVIGGGGLFLKDTNKNNKSGWQWSCSLSRLKQLNVPIAVFAVGYNRFRGQGEFEPRFKNSLKLLTEKAVYVGLRNSGSIRAIRSYLPDELHHKVRFQPCPTTLAKNIYPEIIDEAAKNRSSKTIALNYANDRIEMRLGDKKEEVLTSLAICMKTLSDKGYTIELFAHLGGDEKIVPYLEKEKVPFKTIRLYHMTATEILKEYTRPTVAVGMRGHAQMIPFGCGTPIISLISHDKLAWFLEDIGRPEWGIEMLDPNFEQGLQNKIEETIEQGEIITKDIFKIQEHLLAVSQKNVDELMGAI